MDINDMAVDKLGNIYVTDDWNDRCQKFDGNGRFVTMWGSEGSGPGRFSTPLGIAVDSNGGVFVSDWGNNRIQKFRKAN